MSLVESLQNKDFLDKCVQEAKRSPFVSDQDACLLEQYCAGGTIENDIAETLAGGLPFGAPRKKVLGEQGHQRIIYAQDRRAVCLHSLVARAFRPFEKPLVKHCCSSAVGPGLKDVFTRATQIDANRHCWVLIADVRHYTDNMTPHTARRLLERMVPGDTMAQDFVMAALQPPALLVDGNLIESSEFMRTGTPLNSLLANVALSEADEALAAEALLSMRFLDDMCAWFDTEQAAQAALERVRSAVESCGFQLNDQKCAIIASGQPYCFIGLAISQEGVDLAPELYASAKTFLRSQAKALMVQVRRGVLPPHAAMAMFAQGVNAAMAPSGALSWAFPLLNAITTDKSLKQLDACVQDCMRMVGSGKKGPARYRISYETLKQCGYRSIVNWYYRTYR